MLKDVWNEIYEGQNRGPERLNIPDELLKTRGKKILHISDTPVRSFCFIDELIKNIQPDIIIHTGDMVDDVKVGRLPDKMEDYKSYVRILLGSMKNSKAEQIYIIPGNHDITEFLEIEAPWARVLQEGSKVCIYGKVFGLAHYVTKIPEGAQYYLYGHGRKKDIHSQKDNVPGEECYFNGCDRVHVIVLPEQKFFYISYPQE